MLFFSQPADKRKIKKVVLLQLLGLASLLSASLGCESLTKEDSKTPDLEASSAATIKVVSLSPALSSTAEYLGAEQALVGTSDYYQGKLKLPKLGSALTPNFEGILRVHPDLIVMTQVQGDQQRQLSQLSKTKQYPWLTVNDIASSIALFGKELNKEAPANQLAERFRKKLLQEPAPSAPRIYLTWAAQGGNSGGYFVKRNSAHGALLRAAGGKNAVERDISGSPQLSTEELIQLNPFGIIVLRDGPKNLQKEELTLRELRKLTGLKAVAHDRVHVLSAPGILNMGPSLLNWIAPMKRIIDKMAKTPQKKFEELKANRK